MLTHPNDIRTISLKVHKNEIYIQRILLNTRSMRIVSVELTVHACFDAVVRVAGFQQSIGTDKATYCAENHDHGFAFGVYRHGF